MPSLDPVAAALVAVVLIAIGGGSGLALLVAAVLRARAILRDAEREADEMRERARADALELHREVIALWKKAERALLGPR